MYLSLEKEISHYCQNDPNYFSRFQMIILSKFSLLELKKAKKKSFVVDHKNDMSFVVAHNILEGLYLPTEGVSC